MRAWKLSLSQSRAKLASSDPNRSKPQILPPQTSVHLRGGSSDINTNKVQLQTSSTHSHTTAGRVLGAVRDGSRLRVAYQGFPGAYSESAAAKAYPNCEAVPCEQFETAFNAVECWLVDRAVLPIENSLGGSIHQNYDLLLMYGLHIVGEVTFAVRHCLLTNHGVKIENLKRVVSHPQALAQCENTLTKLGLVREARDDTAGSAQFVAVQKLQDTAAVASSHAAEIYGLNVLAKDIQDESNNVTRFLMLARSPIIPQKDRPYKIESRPLRKKPLHVRDSSNGIVKRFDYLFYVDFEASMADKNSQNAIRHLEFSPNSVLIPSKKD
ncbi:Arogenate dehydratase 2 [Asimina triloba]